MKKNSNIILDEAVDILQAKGMDEAVKLTGLSPFAIQRHWLKRRAMPGANKSRFRKLKYPIELIDKAMDILDMPGKKYPYKTASAITGVPIGLLRYYRRI